MDHLQAQSTKAAERYLLGEMSEPERFDFESHYFECQECADDVRSTYAFADGSKSVFAEQEVRAGRQQPISARPASGRNWWLSWLAPHSLVPTAVAAGLAVVAVYQGLVLIPGLRSRAVSSAEAPLALRPLMRGDEQVVEIRRDRPTKLLSLDVNNAAPNTPLKYEIVSAEGVVLVSNWTQAPPEGTALIVVLQNAEFSRPGSWKLLLRDQKGTEISQYPFSVQIK